MPAPRREHRKNILIVYEEIEIGGDEGDRTPDLCNAIAALSQLSYVPVFSSNRNYKVSENS